MVLDYGTQLSPAPIKLSIGTIKKPLLRDIALISFEKFNLFEAFLKMTPERFLTNIKDNGVQYWDSIDTEQRKQISMYDLILTDSSLCDVYVEIFNFFFVEPVVFSEGLFIILKDGTDPSDLTSPTNIRGVIHDKIFAQTLELIQQVCSIYEKEESTEGLKFKNRAARKIYEKMLKAQKQEKTQKKADINMSLPNIISAVSNMHPTINPINVWDMTVFQLLDSFNRLRVNVAYQIDLTRVSVWGDEKKSFNIALWYKNYYEKK